MVRWGRPDDVPACVALAVLNQGLHASLGVARADAQGFWRRRIVEAAKAGHVRLGQVGRIEAWRLIVAEEEVEHPVLPVPRAPGVVAMLVAHLEQVPDGPQLDLVGEPGGPYSRSTAPADAADRWACSIDNVYVRPGFRRRGLARGMVSLLDEWAAGFGVPALELQVASQNPGALTSWSRLGFTPAVARAEPGFLAMSRPCPATPDPGSP